MVTIRTLIEAGERAKLMLCNIFSKKKRINERRYHLAENEGRRRSRRETKESPGADLDDGFRGRPPAIGHLRGV